MVRRRGGGTGRGQDQGEKRQATTPVGGLYKDSRRNIQGDEEYDEEEEWTQVIHSKQKTPPTLSGSGSGPNQLNQPDLALVPGPSQNQTGQSDPARSYAGAASGTIPKSTHQSIRDEHTTRRAPFEGKWVTPPPEGSMRDDIQIEIRQINGKPFKGSIHIKEARYGIFENCLGFSSELLHGIRFGFSDYPLVKFKLKSQIDIDALQPIEYFDFKRTYRVGNVDKADILSCKIKGIRNDNVRVGEENDPDPNVRWVKVEWAEYSIQKEKIVSWLELYGEPVGHLTEDVHPDSDSESSPMGSGTYSIKMKLHSNIPQIIPMWGKRIRVYYRGVQKLCTNCYGNHPRRNCKSPKVRWIDYVLSFMEKHQDVPVELYGRWKKVVDEEFGEIIESPDGGAEDITATRPTSVVSRETVPDREKQSETATAINKSSMTVEEEDELAEYLNFGLSVSAARDMRQKEKELSDLKFQMRENRRATERGAINARGIHHQTKYGERPTPSGRGRGLTFN